MSRQTNHFSRPMNNQQDEHHLRTAVLDACAQLKRKEIADIRVYDSDDGKNSKSFAPYSKVMVFKLTPEGRTIFESAQKEAEKTPHTGHSSSKKRKKRIVRAQQELGNAVSIFNQARPVEEEAVRQYRHQKRNNWKRNL